MTTVWDYTRCDLCGDPTEEPHQHAITKGLMSQRITYYYLCPPCISAYLNTGNEFEAWFDRQHMRGVYKTRRAVNIMMYGEVG